MLGLHFKLHLKKETALLDLNLGYYIIVSFLTYRWRPGSSKQMQGGRNAGFSRSYCCLNTFSELLGKHCTLIIFLDDWNRNYVCLSKRKHPVFFILKANSHSSDILQLCSNFLFSCYNIGPSWRFLLIQVWKWTWKAEPHALRRKCPCLSWTGVTAGLYPTFQTPYWLPDRTGMRM